MHNNLNDLYSGWGWILWFGFIILMFSGLGNWGYTYSAHRRFGGQSSNSAQDILDERYARGELNREQYSQQKADLASR
jgi:putative membrane protein